LCAEQFIFDIKSRVIKHLKSIHIRLVFNRFHFAIQISLLHVEVVFFFGVSERRHKAKQKEIRRSSLTSASKHNGGEEKDSAKPKSQ
jgi:hypothetical protein